MIDYFMRWSDQAAAKADALMLADYLNTAPGNLKDWARDKVLANVSVWRPSQDTVVGGVVVHTFIVGWFAIVALNRQVPILLNAAALAFALDRDARNAGQPFVVRNNIGTVISDVGVAPVFAGSNYPIGGFTP